MTDADPTVLYLERWRAGDDLAFAALHDRFAPLLAARVRRHRAWPLIEAVTQVEDVVQEVWSRVVPAVQERFRDGGPGSFLAFLGTVTDCAVFDLARRHRTQKRGRGHVAALTSEGEMATRSRPGHPTPETPTSHARVGELLEIARHELSERELEAWELVELQQFTADEAGLAMRCSGAAIRSLLLRSRARLAARIQRGGFCG